MKKNQATSTRASGRKKVTKAKPTTRRKKKQRRAQQPRMPIGFEMEVLPVPAPSFPEIPDRKKRALLAALCTTPSKLQAASAASVDPKTVYNWLHSDDDAFKAAYAVAFDVGCQVAEHEAWKRGLQGWLEPVYQGGRLVGYIRKKSDTMAIFMMKGAMPERYRERYEHTGAGGAPLFAPGFPVPDTGNPVKETA